jgi:hypothetical protein
MAGVDPPHHPRACQLLLLLMMMVVVVILLAAWEQLPLAVQVLRLCLEVWLAVALAVLWSGDLSCLSALGETLPPGARGCCQKHTLPACRVFWVVVGCRTSV